MIMKIEQVIIVGELEFSTLTPLNHNKMLIRYGRNFPSTETLNLTFDSNYYVLTNDVIVRIKTNKNWLVFDFKAGFVWDLASVPNIIKPILDDNEPTAIIGSMVHDYLFSTHTKSFRESNDIFRHILLSQGCSKVKSFLFWFGVSTPIGKIVYRVSTPKRSWHADFCTFRENKTGD